MYLKSKIILISGPTASGKSSFAIKVAKKVDGEIINADSMQVYKELKILSARPDPKKYEKIKHHLYGFHNVTKNFSTGDWLKLVIKKIKEIQKRKKTPILVGGTGLYFKALTDGLVKIPNISLKLRNEIRNLPNQTTGLVITKIANNSPVANSIELNSIIIEAQKKKIRSADDLRDITKEVLNSNQKTVLLAIYNNQNQRRYIGVKLDQ